MFIITPIIHTGTAGRNRNTKHARAAASVTRRGGGEGRSGTSPAPTFSTSVSSVVRSNSIHPDSILKGSRSPLATVRARRAGPRCVGLEAIGT